MLTLAHTLAANDGLLAQLEHQLIGGHHWPVTLLLIIIGLTALRSLLRRYRR